jgi:general secretion pathway protein D
MQSNERLHKVLALLMLCTLIMGGCAGKVAQPPPYFKDIFDSSRQKESTKLEGKSTEEQPGKSADGDTGNLAQKDVKKAVVKIIAIPDPLKRETVKAAAEMEDTQKSPKAPEEDLQKPLELSVQAASGEVQVVVENMPLYDFANLAFGEILKLNYTLSQDVQSAQEKITLNMSRKMTGKDFFPFVVDLLRKNNLDIRDENGVIYVRRKGQQAQQYQGETSSEIYTGTIPADLSPQKKITFIATSSYVPVSQILQVVRQMQLMNSDIKAEVLGGTQALALSGTVGALRQVVGLFYQLDRTSFANRDFNLVYFDYINVVDFDKKMKEVLPTLGIPMGRNISDVGLLTIPFEKINALLVISARKEWLDTLITWKDKLDALESMGDEMQMFVYYPKNRPAEELVEVLKAVSSGGAVQAAVPPAAGTQRPTLPAAVPVAGPVAAGALAVPGKGFSAILDKGRNAVIVSSSPANYKLIRNILIQLDTPPRQVLIEATIYEVTLTDNLQYGVEWFIRHNTGDFTGTISTLGGLALGTSGLSYAISNLAGDFQAKVNLSATNNLINIISTPHIAMLDGKEATITVGTEVPIVTAEASAADISGASGSTVQPSILRSVQYRNTGTILRVKPVINSEGALTIEINQELSEAQTNSVSNIDSPLILNRSIHTTLAVKSGETVLLGGLISTNKSTGESKVPFFGDLPLIGHLFKTNSVGNTKTELIVQITPYILNDLDQLDYITRKFKESVFLK